MKNSYKVAVIGAGVVGCSVAYHLAKLGINDVVVFDKSYISSGSTGRCAGGIRQQWSSPHNVLLAMRSVKLFEKLESETGMDVEYKQGGYLILSYSEEEAEQFEKNVEMQRELGLDVEILSVKKVKERYPYIDLSGVVLATFCQTDGHANPHLVNFAYAKSARKLGVEIFTHTEVWGIEVKDYEFVLHTTKGKVTAQIVVNAAGPHSREIASMVGVDLPTESYRHQIMVTEPVKNFFDPMAISFSGNFYMRQTKHGQFIMGQGDPNEKPGLNYNVTFEFVEEMCKKMTRIFPFLRNVRIVRHWSGHYNMSPDAQPIIGESTTVKNFYYAVGFSGHGFMLAPAVGEAIAELIAYGKTLHVDLSELNLDRFEKTVVRERNVV
ncbi:NAD(P)/FAD-dependent oxidoreductase [Pseudothermotoga thermarum]|uniref:FAD dependent oxidoreductase n=1 Tax=Pseudothermotoga thermarum DSM 5069 TaxID=688269 RepID=F7YW32_9THEM|nr:FAD-binding oxidoreductase [Pseudothermotoga thermarum]AEH50520.1 FAD dependent oxidoreductase [Pseudothermotoga thermarum DSM 5069]